METEISTWHTDAGTSIPVATVAHRNDLPETFNALGLITPRPVLVIVGGAGGLDDAAMGRLRALFVAVLAPLAQERGLTVIDGGTDAGVMRLMGEARAAIAGSFPLVGVAPAGKVIVPGGSDDTGRTPLEPRHSQIVLVPGANWADGVPWIAAVASAIAGAEPSVTLLVDGGEVSWLDAEASVACGRAVIAVAGTGRVADMLAATLAGEASDERAQALLASGRVSLVDIAAGAGGVAAAIGAALARDS